jgi:hypothetical protein
MIYYDESKGGEVPKFPALYFQMTAHNFFEILPGNLSSIHLYEKAFKSYSQISQAHRFQSF